MLCGAPKPRNAQSWAARLAPACGLQVDGLAAPAGHGGAQAVAAVDHPHGAAHFGVEGAAVAAAGGPHVAHHHDALGEALQARARAVLRERFGHAEKSSEEKIKALLAPVGERLKSYEDQVTALPTSSTIPIGS